jgi:hypothetical protein
VAEEFQRLRHEQVVVLEDVAWRSRTEDADLSPGPGAGTHMDGVVTVREWL